MGIDSVAIKTFNSTGSQSVCRTSNADETKLIESEFLTKCKTEYINGSGMSFIAGSLSTFPNSNLSSEEYTLPTDVDAISDIVLQMRFECLPLGVNDRVSSTLILDLINKIEMKIGNLTFQTIKPGDIYARNLTENGNYVNVEHVNQIQASNYPAGIFTGVSGTISEQITGDASGVTGGTLFDYSMSIPFTGRSEDLKRCFLQAGAITNALTMKVTYNKIAANQIESTFVATASTDSSNSTLATDGTGPVSNLIKLSSAPTSFSTGICVFTHQMTSTEKNFLQNNIVNRVIKASQGIRQFSDFSSSRLDKTIVIDMSNININVSHILLSLDRGVFGESTEIDSSIDNYHRLNIDDGVSWMPVGNGKVSHNVSASATKVKSTIGVFKGWLKSAELILGNDRTGNIPVSCLSTDRLEQFGLTSVDDKNIYIIKLAGTAFSTAGVSFSRLNNKKLILTLNSLTIGNFIKTTGNDVNVGSATGHFDSVPPLSATTEDNLQLSTNNTTHINVTCCGTQVQTTVGGSTSFSA